MGGVGDEDLRGGGGRPPWGPQHQHLRKKKMVVRGGSRRESGHFGGHHNAARRGSRNEPNVREITSRLKIPKQHGGKGSKHRENLTPAKTNLRGDGAASLMDFNEKKKISLVSAWRKK